MPIHFWVLIFFYAFPAQASESRLPSQLGQIQVTVGARDEGFRWNAVLNTCARDLTVGRSEGWLGVCGKVAGRQYSGVNWEGLLAEGLDGRYVTLVNVDASRADFSHSELRSSLVHSVKFDRSRFDESDLRGSRWIRSEISQASFQKAKMNGIRFDSLNLLGASFRESDLRKSRWSRCDLRKADFRGADLRDAVFVLTSLVGAHYDSRTRLPFSEQRAQFLGMIAEDSR